MTNLAGTALGIFGIVVFSAWLLFTIAFQRPNTLTRSIAHVDRLNLIPRWSFFAPDPGASNYHVVYRTLDANAIYSPWTELNLVRRGKSAIVWNPDKYYRESMIELFQLLALFSRDHPAEQLQFTAPYITVLNTVKNRLGRSLTLDSTYQFALVETRGPSGSAVPLVRFYSLAHPVA